MIRKSKSKDIQEFIDKKVDLIIVSPNKAAPVTPVIEKSIRGRHSGGVGEQEN
jgi:hypothetical protein